jgi:hypothetical protein
VREGGCRDSQRERSSTALGIRETRSRSTPASFPLGWARTSGRQRPGLLQATRVLTSSGVERKRIGGGRRGVLGTHKSDGCLGRHHQPSGDRGVQEECFGFRAAFPNAFSVQVTIEPLSVRRPHWPRLGRGGSQERGSFYEQGSAVAVEEEARSPRRPGRRLLCSHAL